jgi:hypothetical protein
MLQTDLSTCRWTIYKPQHKTTLTVELDLGVTIEINRSKIGSHHKFTQGIYILESNVDDVLFKSILLAMS